jgi:glycosyltransferase involved in cell wall biosynthesis
MAPLDEASLQKTVPRVDGRSIAPNAAALHILYVNEAFRNFGPGPAVHGWSLVQELRKRNVSVDIFPPVVPSGSRYAPHAPPQRSRLRQFLRTRVAQEHVNLVSGFQRTTRRVLSAWTQSRRLTPDVILARHTGYDWTPWVLARVLNRPLVLEVNAPIHLEKRLVGIDPSAVLKWTEQVQWRKATRIHAVSRQLANVLVDAGVSSERIVTIPNGADPLGCQWNRDTKADSPVRILFVGSFYSWHGVEHLLEAVAALPHTARNLRLSLVGAGPQSSSVRQLASKLGIGNLVEMPGRIAHNEVCQHLCDADIAIASYPRLQAFYFSPLKIFEYMAAGLPIIASDQGQISEVLTHGETALLYPPGDITRLAESITHLMARPTLRKQLGCAALALLKNRYTWGHTAERIIELCRDAVESHEVEKSEQIMKGGPRSLAEGELSQPRPVHR